MWLPGSHHTRTCPPGSASRRRRRAAESTAKLKMPAGGATGSEEPPGSLDRGNFPEPAHLRRRRASVAPAAAVPDKVAPATRREPAARRPTGTVAPGQWRRQGGCQPGRVRAGLSPIPPGGRALAARLTQRRSGTAACHGVAKMQSAAPAARLPVRLRRPVTARQIVRYVQGASACAQVKLDTKVTDGCFSNRKNLKES